MTSPDFDKDFYEQQLDSDFKPFLECICTDSDRWELLNFLKTVSGLKGAEEAVKVLQTSIETKVKNLVPREDYMNLIVTRRFMRALKRLCETKQTTTDDDVLVQHHRVDGDGACDEVAPSAGRHQQRPDDAGDNNGCFDEEIGSWHTTFSGSSSGLPIDEFKFLLSGGMPDHQQEGECNVSMGSACVTSWHKTGGNYKKVSQEEYVDFGFGMPDREQEGECNFSMGSAVTTSLHKTYPISSDTKIYGLSREKRYQYLVRSVFSCLELEQIACFEQKPDNVKDMLLDCGLAIYRYMQPSEQNEKQRTLVQETLTSITEEVEGSTSVEQSVYVRVTRIFFHVNNCVEGLAKENATIGDKADVDAFIKFCEGCTNYGACDADDDLSGVSSLSTDQEKEILAWEKKLFEMEPEPL